MATVPGRPTPQAVHHAQKQRLYHRQNGRCLGCRQSIAYGELTRHHVILHARGGPDHDANICLLCQACHDLCHHPDKRVQHDALRPILLAFGYTEARQRAVIYQMYRQTGVYWPRVSYESVRRRELAVELKIGQSDWWLVDSVLRP